MTERTLRGYESLADFAPDWISAPGETIAELLDERGWSQADFAVRTGFTAKHVHLLLQGKAGISEDAALRLERVLGSSARFWLNLETQYREQLLRRQAIASFEQDVVWLKELPLAEMIALGLIYLTPQINYRRARDAYDRAERAVDYGLDSAAFSAALANRSTASAALSKARADYYRAFGKFPE